MGFAALCGRLKNAFHPGARHLCCSASSFALSALSSASCAILICDTSSWLEARSLFSCEVALMVSGRFSHNQGERTSIFMMPWFRTLSAVLR